jgi:hypothetical protein
VILDSSASSRLHLPARPESDGYKSKAGDNAKRETMKNKSTIAILTTLLIGSSMALADSGIPKNYPLKKCRSLVTLLTTANRKGDCAGWH